MKIDCGFYLRAFSNIAMIRSVAMIRKRIQRSLIVLMFNDVQMPEISFDQIEIEKAKPKYADKNQFSFSIIFLGNIFWQQYIQKYN